MALGSKLLERYLEVVKLNQGVASGYAAWFAKSTATTAGGSTNGVQNGTAGTGWYVGSGAPTISAAKGSLYCRTDGSSTSTRVYVNTDGGTTWTNVTTAA